MIKIYIPRETTSISLGADEVAEAFTDGGKTAGQEIEIIRSGSYGLFWLEPLIEIEADGNRTAFGPIAPKDVKEFAANGFKSGPNNLGAIEELPYLKSQTRLTFARCGKIDALDLQAFKSLGGLQGAARALDLSQDEIISEVDASGLRGRGGAAFPAHIKWRTVQSTEADTKYIICNADEGDSGTFADRLLMECDPFSLIEGMLIAGLGTGAEEGIIYLRSEYPLARDILSEAVEIATNEGWLGDNIQGSGKRFDIELRMGAGAYICGEETSLLESLEGKRGQVRAKPPLPAIEGLFGKPTLVHNVLSLAAAGTILAKGGAFYGGYGADKSRGTMPFQLAGNVKQGGLVEVPFGLSVKELVDQFGGGTASGREIRAVQIGGPLGAYIPPHEFDLSLTYEALMAKDAMVGHGGVVVFDDTADMGALARFAMEFCAIESCGKCTPCRIGSVRGTEVIDKILSDESREENIVLLHDLCETMTDGSLCAMGGMTPVPVLSALKHFPEDFGVSNKKTPKAAE